jgi:hypothetical protein
MKTSSQQNSDNLNFSKYFKVGVSPDFILIRNDFPMTQVSPSEFSKLCVKMFRRNDEVLKHGK